MSAISIKSLTLFKLAIAIYFIGVATPVVLLKMLARDKNDSCFLTFVLTLVLLFFLAALGSILL